VTPGPAEAGRGADAAPDGGADSEGRGRSRGLFRRARRSATRPEGPPERPEVPEVPQARQSQAAQSPQVPMAQAPVVIFQPPDIAAAAQRRPEPGGAPAAGQETPEPARPSGADEQDEDGGTAGASGRRRRRGGRGHGKGREAGEEGAEQRAEAPAAGASAGDEARDTGSRAAAGDGTDSAGEAEAPERAETAAADTAAKRRRRRRRSGSASDAEESASDDPPNTVVHVRPSRAAAAEEAGNVKGVKGSTRLEAKRQRRREGRESGRRRPPIITESEFLARREAVERVMVVRQRGDRTQIAVLEDGVLVEHYVDRSSHQSYVGNVYLGRVQNVLPSMEAAFVDIGKGRNAVLYAGEVNFDASGLEGESKRIESALKSGQSIVVQVTKDPIGHKGARLTSQVSLPGRYLVYVPGASMTGISRKLPDTERARLKQILKQVMPEDAGVIVRTAAEGASQDELSRDVARLTAQWEAIEHKAKSATAPELLYGEPDLTIRVVRDIFNEDFTKLVIASDGEWDVVGEYVRYVAPGLAERLERWADDEDVFAVYRIDEQIAKALERKVWLPSGGSLVIDTTEAMTVIDVNTGKFTGQGGNLEQTVTRNNLEAAEEIVRQLRVRDVGGIIVIDFIDMVLESNRDLVLRRLLECLARDRTKHQVAEVTSLGLVQMTRKRVGSGLLEAFSVPCEHCNGRGVIVSLEPVEHAPADHHHGRDSAAKASAAKGMAAVAASSGMSPAVPAASGAGTGAAAPAGGGEDGDGTGEAVSSPQPRGRRRRRGGSARGQAEGHDGQAADGARAAAGGDDLSKPHAAGQGDVAPGQDAVVPAGQGDGAPGQDAMVPAGQGDVAPGQGDVAPGQDAVVPAGQNGSGQVVPAPQEASPNGPVRESAAGEGKQDAPRAAG
jgi:ribonuclease E